MNDALSDIRDKLRQGAYKNEEHVRLNLVTRLLAELGWNVWDPAEVNAEWVVARTEDATKVDLALFANSGDPSVFMEIKAVGKLSDNLLAIEKQLRDYNRNNTAMFSVITDGQGWRLYFSQTGGEFAEKCFKVVDVLHGDLLDVERTLTSFLSKAAIDIGSARAEAEKYLQLGKKQRAIDDCLSEARRQVQEPPYQPLPECLVDLVGQKGFVISREDAIAYISKATNPAVTAVSTQPNAPPPNRLGPRPTPGPGRPLLADNPGDLRFTRILEGEIAGLHASRWNELVAVGVRFALSRGFTLQDLSGSLPANLRQGNHGDRGFALIPGTDVSIQNMDANHAARSLVLLARTLHCRLRVVVHWVADSPFAGETGVLELNP